MTDRDPLGTTLEALEPPFADELVDWDDVLRRAGGEPTRAPRRRRRRLAMVALATAAAICAALIVDPFGRDEAGVVDRALAAIGDGPVLHVVTRTGIGGTLVDLGSGRGTEVRIEQETWFDPARGFRGTLRLGGTVLEEYSAPAGKPVRVRAVDRAMQVFTRDYREALRDGRARLLREGEVGGTPVYWLRVEVDTPAPSLPGCGGRACQDVAVSRETYEPVYVRFGPPRRGLGQRVLDLESLPAGSGEIPGTATATTLTSFQPLPRRRADRSLARRLLETPLVWPGRRLAGLGLARIEAGGVREYRFSRSMRRPRFRPPNHVITLVFGVRGELLVNEARRHTYGLLRGPKESAATPFGVPAGYVPPRGSALVARGGRQAILRRGDLVIGIAGSRPDAVRAALRAVSRAR